MRSQFPHLCSASILNQRKPELAAVSAWLLQGSTDYISVPQSLRRIAEVIIQNKAAFPGSLARKKQSGSVSLIDIFMTLIYYGYSSFHITFHTLNIQYVAYLIGGLL